MFPKLCSGVSNMKGFQVLLSSFLLDYLPRQRGFSENTIKSYRDCFVLFFEWMQEHESINPERIQVSDLSVSRIEGFLRWLEEDKGCKPATCNNRLAALKSLARYTQSEAPEAIAICSSILAIPAKKYTSDAIPYLSIEAVKNLIESSSSDIREHAIISLLYDSGARVSELSGLCICDLRIADPCTLKLTGKGGKARIVPISRQVRSIMERYMEKHRSDACGSMPLFINHHKNRLGRAGVAHILKKHTDVSHKDYPDIVPKEINPHMLRHSKAMHLLESGVNLIYIRDFLGHESVTTTEIYAKANPEVKRKAIEAASNNIIRESKYDSTKRDSLAQWLKEII